MARERPILFSGPMVRAILRERDPKTQTRRVMSRQLDAFEHIDYDETGGWVVWWDHCPGGDPSNVDQTYLPLPCPYGQVGDRLWVRETCAFGLGAPKCQVAYKADGRCVGVGGDSAGGLVHVDHGWLDDSKCRGEALGQTQSRKRYGPWKPSIHMPRWASRITLEIVNVRVQRVQEISPEDAEAEGIGYEQTRCDGECGATPCSLAVGAFHHLWDSINAKRGYGWAVNPWVWAITFRRIKP